MDEMTAIIYLCLFMVGVSVGSFLNVCIFRIPLGKSIVTPPSACRFCGHRIRWWENIPLISFIILRGKCRICQARLSWQYPVVEFLGVVILVGNYIWWNAIDFHMVFYSLLGFLLIVIAFIDLRHYWIPNKLILAGLAIGLAGIPVVDDVTWQTALIGGAAGGLGLWFIRLLGYILFRKESLGWGDIKLASMAGIFLGWQKMMITIGLGFFFAFLFGVGLIVLRREPGERRIPLGSFLALGTLTSLWYGKNILDWYWKFLTY